MKKQLKNLTPFLSLSLAFNILVTSNHTQAVSSASMYLSPSNAALTPGSELSVSLYENSGADNVNVVQASLSYPEDLGSVISITSSSGFGVEAGTSFGNGAIKIIRGAYPPVASEQLVATVVFRVLGSGGVVSINFDQTKSAVIKVASPGSPPQNILASVAGSSYNLAPVATTPPTTTPPAASPPKTAPAKTGVAPAKKAAPDSLSAALTKPSFVNYTRPPSRTWQPVAAVSVFASGLWGTSLLTNRRTHRRHLHLFSAHILEQIAARAP